jgi:STAM-binding protein
MNLPLPNKETLSRHSFLGPNGLRGQWLGPSAEIKVKLMFGFVMLSDHQ